MGKNMGKLLVIVSSSIEQGQRMGKKGIQKGKWTNNPDGNLEEASGTLKVFFTKTKRSSAEIKAQGLSGKNGLPGDQGGHIVAHRFVKDQGGKNLFPQNGNFNNSAFKTIENDYVRFIKKGYTVKFKHKLLKINPKTGRPGSIKVEFTVTDANNNIIDEFRDIFKNGKNQIYERRSK